MTDKYMEFKGKLVDIYKLIRYERIFLKALQGL
jgi:hypothetical protein